MDEPTLLAALAADLELAFDELVRARQDRLYSIALRILGDPTEAEDVAQDAFVRAYRALAAWDAARIRALRLDPWLATIVTNVARTRIKRRAPAGAQPSLTFLDELDHPVAAARDTPPDRLAVREARRTWAARLLDLPSATGCRSSCATSTASTTTRSRSPSTDPRARSRPRSIVASPCSGP